MSTNVPGFQSFFCFLHHFVLGNLATSRISVGSRPNFRGRLIAEIFERLIDHGRPIEGKLKEKYNKKKRMKIGEEMAE